MFSVVLRERRLSADRPKQKPCPPGLGRPLLSTGPRLLSLMEGHEEGHNVCAAAATATLYKMCCQRPPAAPECSECARVCVCVCVTNWGGKAI